MKAVVLPFNLDQVQGHYSLLEVLIYAVVLEDQACVFDFIDDLVEDQFKTVVEEQAEIRKLVSLAEINYWELYPLIHQLINNGMLTDEFTISDITRLGQYDMVLHFTNELL